MKLAHMSREKGAALFFLLPSILGFSLFFIIPFIFSFYYSLIDNPVIKNFIGLSNYVQLLKNPVFLKACSNTAIFTALSVPLNLLLSILLALGLNQNIYIRNFLRTAFILPLIVPAASVVLIWQVIFNYNGALNNMAALLGYNPVDWMNSSWARAVVIMFYLWKNVGYNMILFLAALQNIPKECYEAAELDGAGRWRKLTNITMVYLIPTTYFVFIISIINSFKVFREVYLISGGYPHESIYMLQHYMNNMFAALDYQKLTTAAVVMAVFIYAVVLVFFRLERKISQSIE